MRPNPYEYKPPVEAENPDPLDAVFMDVLKATSYYSPKITPEDSERYLKKLQAQKEIIISSFTEKFYGKNRVMDILRRLQSAWDPDSEEPYKNDFVALGLDLFEELQPQIERAVKRGAVGTTDLLLMYSNLAERGNENQPYNGIGGLMDHIDLIEKRLMGHGLDVQCADYLRLIIELGDAEQQSAALALLFKVADTKIDEPQFPGLISELYSNSKNDKVAENAIQKFLERHQLPFAEIYSAWRQSSNPSHRKRTPKTEEKGRTFKETMQVNLETIREVDSNNPGTCRFLYDKFNIADFGRYPTELLLKQREEFNSLENPYGVAIFPRSDYNGAFYNDISPLKELLDDLKGEFSLRVAECEGKVDIVRALQKFDELYNPPDGSGHKISLLILGGHGTENSIRFGFTKSEKSDVLRTEDLTRKISGKAGEYLDKNSTIILSSCSTGAEHGIGQELSKRFGAKVVAPKVPTSTRSLHGSRNRGGNFRFNAQYVDKGKNVFSQGEPVLKQSDK